MWKEKGFRLSFALSILEIVWMKGKITDEEWLKTREALIKKLERDENEEEPIDE